MKRIKRPTICSSCRKRMWKTKNRWYGVQVQAFGRELTHESFMIFARNAVEARLKARQKWNGMMRPQVYRVEIVKNYNPRQGGH